MTDLSLLDSVKSSHHHRLGVEAEAMARAARRPLVGRIGFQLGGAMLVGIIAPVVLRWPLEVVSLDLLDDPWQANTVAASVLAMTLGYVVIRQFIAYPGTQVTSYILPCLLVSFGLVSLAFLLSRIDYSRYVFVTSLVLGIGWLHIVFHLRNRHALPMLALVPGGDSRNVAELGYGARWLKLERPADSLRGVEGVVADLHAAHPPDWERFIGRCILAGVPVYEVRNVLESITGRVDIRQLSENSFGSVLPSNLYMNFKRLLDVALAAILLLPVCMVIAVAASCIRLETKGPAFFVQPRMGYRGKTFRIFKLRSMRTDMPGGEHFTTPDDRRVTPFGKFIRKYRIDELPQIFNIIRGDMSWIGPRPEAVTLGSWYAQEIPFYIYRHAVRPGISGWAQVNQGNVARVDAAMVKLQYDFYYIKNFSPWLDLLISLKTIRTILTGFGSR